jgi:hypothetical protein
VLAGGGVYMAYSAICVFPYIQLGMLMIGLGMLCVGILFCSYTLDGKFIEFSDDILTVRNVFKRETKRIELKDVTSWHLQKSSQKGIEVKELVLVVNQKLYFISLFGFSSSALAIERKLKRKKRDPKLKKVFFKRDLKILAYMAGVIGIVMIVTMVLSSNDTGRELEARRSFSENAEYKAVRVVDHSRELEKRGNRILRITLEVDANPEFDFLVSTNYFTDAELNILLARFERGTHAISVLVNDKLFTNKFDGTDTPMSYHEKHFTYEQVIVYGIKIRSTEYGKGG